MGLKPSAATRPVSPMKDGKEVKDENETREAKEDSGDVKKA